jgi:hypothetical protein
MVILQAFFQICVKNREKKESARALANYDIEAENEGREP